VSKIGFFDIFSNSKAQQSELEQMFQEELALFYAAKSNAYMKKLAIDACVSFLGRTISQSTFNVKKGKTYVKDTMHYKFNVRPNINQTASTFWEKAIYKLVHDNEVLIVQTDTDDLLIADSYLENKFSLYESTFSGVTVDDFEFKRVFMQSEVIHIKYKQDKFSGIIESLADDYADMFTSLVRAQKRKSQIRAIVKIDGRVAAGKDAREKIQKYIQTIYGRVADSDVAIIPEQEGFDYNEKATGTVGTGQSVDEVNRLTNGFFDKVATVLGIPSALLYGEMADVEKQTKNFIRFTVKPLLKKIQDEINGKFFSEKEFLSGNYMEITPVSYYDVIEIASAIDKLISSGAFTTNEVRRKVGEEPSDDPNADRHILTKNYGFADESQDGENMKGGESDNANAN
jgi:HK97 family phage portal protein